MQLNKPYFVAVSVKLSDTEPTGVTFYAKDLSNDDEPMLISQNSHRVVKIPEERGMFTITAVAEIGPIAKCGTV